MDAPWYAELENSVPRRRQRNGRCQARSASGENRPDAEAFLNRRSAPSSLSRTMPMPPDPKIMPLRRRSNGIAARDTSANAVDKARARVDMRALIIVL